MHGGAYLQVAAMVLERWSRWLGGVLCAAVLVSAVVLIVAALSAQPRALWFLAAFEVVVAIAGGMGVAVALGWRREDAPASLACVALGVGLCTAFGFYGAGWAVAGIPLRGLLAARLAAAGVLALLAAMLVIGRDTRRALPRLLLGVALFAAFAAMVGASWLARARIASMPAGVRFLGGILALLVAIGLLAAAVHWVMSAFDAGAAARERERPDAPDGRATTGEGAGA